MKDQVPADTATQAARAREPSSRPGEHDALALQRSAGNAAVASLVTSRGVSGVLMRNGHGAHGAATAEARDIARYDAAKARHDRNRATVQGWLTSGAAQIARPDAQELVPVGQPAGKLYVLTETHDSTARCTAAAPCGGKAWFSYPAGELSAAAVYYTRHAAAADPWDNTNIDFEDSPDGGRVQRLGSQNVIALMETAIARGSEYFYSVLKHETQHAAD